MKFRQHVWIKESSLVVASEGGSSERERERETGEKEVHCDNVKKVHAAVKNIQT